MHFLSHCYFSYSVHFYSRALWLCDLVSENVSSSKAPVSIPPIPFIWRELYHTLGNFPFSLLESSKAEPNIDPRRNCRKKNGKNKLLVGNGRIFQSRVLKLAVTNKIRTVAASICVHWPAQCPTDITYVHEMHIHKFTCRCICGHES